MKDLKNIKADKKLSYTRGIGAILILIVLIVTTLRQDTTAAVSAETTGTKVIVTIDYQTEIATIAAGPGGSTKFYMSTDKMKTWEIVNKLVDISTLLLAKDNIIYFKGNKDTGEFEQILPAEDSLLKVTYEITGGEGSIKFPSGLPVEYRKGANGTWNTALSTAGVSIFNDKGSTSIFEVRGATLYFRTKATAAKRAGKMVAIKISKRPTAPSVKLDGSKLSITGLKANETYYRIGDSVEWLPFKPVDLKSKSIDLYTLFNIATSAWNEPIQARVVEFQTLGSAKKVNSAIRVVEVPLQPTVPDTIVVSGASIKITDSDTKRAYEYTKVDKGSTFNISTAKWSSVSTKNAFVVPKASSGDRILVRLKSRTDSVTKKLIPASTYKDTTINLSN